MTARLRCSYQARPDLPRVAGRGVGSSRLSSAGTSSRRKTSKGRAKWASMSPWSTASSPGCSETGATCVRCSATASCFAASTSGSSASAWRSAHGACSGSHQCHSHTGYSHRLRVRTPARHARSTTGRVVVGVAVVPPRRDDDGVGAALADDVDEARDGLVGVDGEVAVGETEPLDRRGRCESGQRRAGLLDPESGKVVARQGGGAGMRRLAVGEQHDRHLEPGSSGESDESAGGERLVVGVGGDDDESTAPRQERVGRPEVAPLGSLAPLGLCRARLGMREGPRAGHHGPPPVSPSPWMSPPASWT